MRRQVNWLNVTCVGLALFVFASTFRHGRWGEHYDFLIAYAITLLYCAWRRLWVGVGALAVLIWLRFDLMEGRAGWELRLSSTAFVVGLFLLCMEAAGDLRKRDATPS